MTPATRITILNLVARAAHLLLFLIIGNRFGATISTDTILLLQAPLLIVMSVSVGVTDVVIMPAIHRALHSYSSITLIRKFRFYGLLSITPLAVTAVLIGSYISPEATYLMMLILLPMPVFTFLAGMHAGILNASNMHGRAAIGPLYGGFLSIPVLFILPLEPETLALSLLSFELAKYIGLRYHSRHVLRSLHDQTKPDNELIIWAIKGAIIQAIGSFVLAMNLVIDDLFASQLSQGSVSLVEYASRLWNLVPLLLVGYVTLSYATMSKLAADNKLENILVHKTAIKLGLYALLLSLGASLLCQPVIDLVYGYGSMDIADRKALSILIIFYLIGAGPFLAGQVYVKAHSAMGNAKVMTIVAIISVFINIIGNMLLIPVLGLNGIGLATSIAYTCSAFFLAYPYFRSKKLSL